MALQRNNGTSSLMNALRNNVDNGDHVVDRKMVGKSALSGQQRAALGNISNRTTTLTRADTLKLKGNDEFVKPAMKAVVKNVQRQPTVLTHVKEEAVVKQEKVVVKEDKVELVESRVQTRAFVLADSVKPEVVVHEVVHQTEAPMDTSCSSLGEDAFSKQMWKLNVLDIDAEDADNPQLVSEYVNDIYEYMRELERIYPIRSGLLSTQTDVNGRMRGILIDWLVQVHLRFHLLQETLFLTVAILDRFLQLENITKSKLQLVGVTSMWIAAKYEEMYAPEVADFVYITDNAYSKADIRQMECQILKAIDFQLGRPLAIHFLRRNSKAGEVDAITHTMAKYLMELTIVDYELAHVNPSEIAAAALCLSVRLLSNAPWSATLVHYSRYTESDLQPLLTRLAHLIVHAGTGKLVAIKTKYQSSKFMRISKCAELESSVVQELAAQMHA